MSTPAVTSVLVVSDDRELVSVAMSACRAHEASVRHAPNFASVSVILSDEPADLAVLDARTDAVIALVPLVRTMAADIVVAAVVDPDDGHSVRAVLDLGVDALIAAPLTGDAVLRVLAKTREDRGLRVKEREAEEAIARANRAVSEMRRLVGAVLSTDDELVETALDAIAEIAPSVRATVDMRPREEPITAASAEVPRIALGEEGREIGTMELIGGEPDHRVVALEIASALSTLLAARRRIGTPAHGATRIVDKRQFDDHLLREVDKARRHSRRLSVLALDLATVDTAKLTDHLRASDVVGRSDREIFVLLPETGTIGAARLRRRITRGAVGFATMPVDGTSRERLVSAARAKRESMARSPLANVEPPSDVTSFVDELLARPPLEGGALAIYPLVLSLTAAVSMVKHACLDIARRSEAFVDIAGPESIVFAVREVERECGERFGVLEHRARDGVFAIVLTSELGTWACAGRVDGDEIAAVHGADPFFGDRMIAALEAE